MLSSAKHQHTLCIHKPAHKPHTHMHAHTHTHTHTVNALRNKAYQVQIQRSQDTNTILCNYKPAKTLFTYLLMRLIAC